MLLFLYVAGTAWFCVHGAPQVDTSQVQLLQTEIDKGQPLNQAFSSFKRIFNKTYNDDFEDEMRRKIFEENVNYIHDHNLLYAKGETSYYLGVNGFTDLTHKEFVLLHTGQIFDTSSSAENGSLFLPSPDILPDTLDWRDKGLVTGVKDQGQCGSCWAFSTTGSLEGQHKKKTGSLISLSEQQLVDCSYSYGNDGCDGGLESRAFNYIKHAGGIESEEDYPYVAREHSYCNFRKSKSKATVSGYKRIPRGSESSLKQAVAGVGPISVAIDASHNSFQHYRGGVYDESRCSTTTLDHAVLVVGYGTSPSDYWLVKNSWGKLWGMDGYIKMSRNKHNQCGIATEALFPLV